MCIFVAFGADAPVQFIRQVFEERAELDLGAVCVCLHVAKVFPSSDEVRLVTVRGCSCDLLAPPGAPSSRSASAKCASGFRRAVADVVRQVGSARLFVHRHAGVPRDPCRAPNPQARLTLNLREFMTCEQWFVEDALLEISAEAPSEGVVFS